MKTKFAIVLLITGSIISAYADQMGEPTHSAAFPDVLTSPYPWTFRQWNNGFMVGLDQREGDKARLVAYDADGGLALSTTIMPLIGSDLSLIAATFDPAGNLFVAGGSMGKDGPVNFIAQVKSDGSFQRVVRVNPFASMQICSAEAGRVWALGWQRGEKQGSAYPILREYDLAGGQSRSAFPRNTVRLASEGGSGNTLLRCTSQSVIVYGVTSGELLKFDLKTNGESTSKVAPIDTTKTNLTGFAVTEDGKIYSSLHQLPTKSNPAQAGLFTLSGTGAAVAKWEPVASPVHSGLLQLIGASGKELLYRDDTRDPSATVYSAPVTP